MAFLSATTAARPATLSADSLKYPAATAPDPRISESISTSSVYSPPSFLTLSVSPSRTSRDAFARTPLHSTRPPSHASLAKDLVLKNRAAQSHLSIRTLFKPIAFAKP